MITTLLYECKLPYTIIQQVRILRLRMLHFQHEVLHLAAHSRNRQCSGSRSIPYGHHPILPRLQRSSTCTCISLPDGVITSLDVVINQRNGIIVKQQQYVNVAVGTCITTGFTAIQYSLYIWHRTLQGFIDARNDLRAFHCFLAFLD